MNQNLFDDRRVFDTGNDLDGAAALTVGSTSLFGTLFQIANVSLWPISACHEIDFLVI